MAFKNLKELLLKIVDSNLIFDINAMFVVQKILEMLRRSATTIDPGLSFQSGVFQGNYLQIHRIWGQCT